MLVISRRENEVVLIGEVRVMVTRIGGDQVRLGIDAPPDVPILRAELVERGAGDFGLGAGGKQAEATRERGAGDLGLGAGGKQTR